MVYRLQDLQASDRNRFGAKAVNLGLLMQRGGRVPPGFALSIDTYNKFMECCGAANLLENTLANTDKIRERIREAITQAWESEIVEPICEELWLGGNKIAVRSSAILEDAADTSFAGIYSSETGLTELDEVLEAVRRCYASLYSDEAISAYLRWGKDLNSAAMAVILQAYVDGSPSGVLFTSDAVAMDDSHMVVNAVAGPCSDMVDGNVNVMLMRIPRNADGISQPRDMDTAKDRILTDGQVEQLRKAGLEIEGIVGPRQDIEWTFTGNEMWILQARPITTFKVKVDAEAWDPHDGSAWSLEAFSQALAPLEQEIVAKYFQGSRAGAVETGNTSVAADFVVRSGYFYSRSCDIPNQTANRKAWGRYVAHQHTKGQNIYEDILLPQIIDWQDKLDAFVERELRPEEIAEFLQQSLEYTCWISAVHWKAVWGTCFLVGCPEGRTFADEYQHFLEPFSNSDITDLVYVPTELSATGRSLAAMAEMVRKSSILHQVFDKHSSNDIVYSQLQALREADILLKEMALLSERCWRYQTGTWREPLAPTVSEKRATLVGWIRPYLAADPRNICEAVAEAEKRKETVKRAIVSELSPSAEERFRIALSLAEKAYRCRDDHAHFIDSTIRSYARISAVRAGEYLLNKGLLDAASDIWLMTSDEIVSWLIGERGTVRVEDLEQRRQVHKSNGALLPPTSIGTAKPSPSDSVADGAASTAQIERHVALPGISGLAAVVRGTAVVYSGDDLQLTEPAILVLPDVRSLDIVAHLDFLVGVIVETGSPYSHLGIIARELSIPCLFGVDGATSKLKSGDRLEIDGVKERVTRLSPSVDSP